MTLGQKIKKLRNEKDMTQKDLADQLHVTFQTVSKWEKDENEPDVATLRELAKLFDCSMDWLLSEEEGSKTSESTTPPVQPQPVIKTIIIHEKEKHVCARCKKDIPENDLEIEKVPEHSRYGRNTTTTYHEEYYHKECFRQVVDERNKAEARRKAEKAESAKNRSFGWGIAAGVVFLITSLILMFTVWKDVFHPAVAIVLSILIGYAAFADLYCILSGSYIAGVFLTIATKSIRFPGIIFSFDIGGFFFLIAMKALFAVLGLLIGLALIAFAVALSMALAAVSFPFVLVKNINNQYEDAL